ncbi:MAG: cytochrome c maturation protein CcmE [Alphaproteobacteria bacterium]
MSLAAGRKRRRLYLVGASLAALAGAAWLVLGAFEDSVVFFYSPAQLAAEGVQPGQRIRLGGLVAAGSVARDGATARFTITDGAASTPVVFTGTLPDLFREGQGVVTEGALAADGTFAAETVLAKHDENYMPREVADALKAAGRWQHAGEGAPPAAPPAAPAPAPAPAR